ncbi:MAG TPA: hypothetical protein VGN34_26870 [Ktedonobacteraceae bacterium]|jgi:hypothetical protein
MANDKFEIYVPSSRTFLVTCNGKEVSNWRELQQEARAVAEPAIRERWLAHWQKAVVTANIAQQAEKLEDMMPLLLSPNMYYECPAELAAKAIL